MVFCETVESRWLQFTAMHNSFTQSWFSNDLAGMVTFRKLRNHAIKSIVIVFFGAFFYKDARNTPTNISPNCYYIFLSYFLIFVTPHFPQR